MNDTKYIEEIKTPGNLDVVFISRDSGKRLVRSFQSPYLAKQFANKVRHSKKLTLVSYPNERW